MIKFKLKETPISLHDERPLVTYLRQLGIEKVSSFLEEPDREDELSPSLLINIDEVVDILHEGFVNNKNFYLQPDSDVDGYTSAAIFYRYFKDLFPQATIAWEMHENKFHGIDLNKICVQDDIIVIPDAGSNNFEEQKILAQKGQKVVIIDHHEMDYIEDIQGVYLTNNQISPDFPNKSLSGSGMMYKVIQHHSRKYGDGKYHENFLDLAAVGIIADMMDTRDLDNNYIVYHGLRNIKNPLLKALLESQSYSISAGTPTKIDIAFYIAPLINAVIRVGSLQENTEFFQMLIDYNNDKSNVRVTDFGISSETLYEEIARESHNTRARQNSQKEAAMKFLDTRVQRDGLHHNSLITVIASDTDKVALPKTMTGLVAMEFVKKYQKPVLVLRPKTENGVQYLAGSGRSVSIEGFMSLREELNQSGIVEFAAGHDNAFGVMIRADRLEELIDYMNENFAGLTFGDAEIEVDYHFELGQATSAVGQKALWEFATASHLYGNQIPEPKFAFEVVAGPENFQVMGKNKNTIKISAESNGKQMNYLFFHASELVEAVTTSASRGPVLNGTYRFIIIGRPQVNYFRGNKSLQIIVEDYGYEKANMKNLLI